MGAEADSGADEQQHHQGRQLRSAAGRPRDRHHDRPRHRDAPGTHAERDRQHALRRVRAAAGLDHLQRAEPVSRRHGGRAALLAGSAHAGRALRLDLRRQSDRHAADGNLAAGLFSSSTRPGAATAAAIAADSARNLATNALAASGHTARFGRRGGHDLDRDDGAAVRLRPLRAWPYAAQRQSSGAVRGLDDLVQSGLRPRAERSEDRDRGCGQAHRHAVDRARRISPARRRPISSRSRTCRCCSAQRS